MTVTLKKNKLRGSGDAVWVVSSVRAGRYDGGVIGFSGCGIGIGEGIGQDADEV